MSHTEPTLPDGLLVYAIGDVHGRFDLLEAMAKKIAADLSAAPASRSVEIFLGDYVDRGPQSREVVEWLIETPPLANERICLLGNHEEMMLRALADPSEFKLWLLNGGEATLASYGLRSVPTDPVALQATCAAAIPASHLKFLAGLPRKAEFGTYLFVHAGIDPSRPLSEQDPRDLVWIRGRFLNSNADFGRIVVHGHTPVEEPDIRRNRIDIDTGAVFSERLTCLALEGATQRVIQTR
jgi:serine/threonine protein phosphatase 1